ncbi:MAG TPA: transposase [Thermoanaerobaculia bacterium]|nr:transposase [Thermoanaerobaculia bacterium]
MRHDNFIPDARIITARSRGRLPHWQVDDAVYFITFRLRDALPRDVARQLFLERQHMLRNCETTAERARLDIAFGIRLDRELDAHRGSCLLRVHGDLVANALKYFDGSRYELHAWCVMPNHVHVMFHITAGADVPLVLHSWKSYTAHRIGKGVIWQREYFDRVVRSPQEFNETAAYIRANPASAGLSDWRWIG